MTEGNQQGCLLVGEGVVLKGNFVVPDIAIVSGTIEGELSATQVIIESSGRIHGKVLGAVVDVHGELVDHLAASQSLIIRSTGKVHGVIQYAEIEIEKGGSIHGDLHVLGLP